MKTRTRETLGVLFGLVSLSVILSMVTSLGEHPRFCDGGPCEPNILEGDIGPYVFVLGYACDPWCVLHITTPMLLTLFLGNPWYAYLLTGLSEIVEVFAIAMTGSYVFFLEDPSISTGAWENQVGALIDDWLIQGGIGVFVGYLIIITFRPFPKAPITWEGLLSGRRLDWIHSVYLLLGVVALPLIYVQGVESFPGLQALIHPFAQALLFLVFWWIQRQNGGTLGRAFYWPPLALLFLYHGLNTFSWYCSCAVQSWIVSGGVIGALCLLWAIQPSLDGTAKMRRE